MASGGRGRSATLAVAGGNIFCQNTGPMGVGPLYTLDVRNSIFYNSPHAVLACGGHPRVAGVDLGPREAQ
jgi:hypothetical protein